MVPFDTSWHKLLHRVDREFNLRLTDEFFVEASFEIFDNLYIYNLFKPDFKNRDNETQFPKGWNISTI